MAKFHEKFQLKAKPVVREARGRSPTVRWANRDDFKEVAQEPVNARQNVGDWLQQVLNGEFKVHEGVCDASSDKFSCHFLLAPLSVPFSSPSGGGEERTTVLEDVVAEATNFARLRISDAKEFSIEKMNGDDVLVIGSIEEALTHEQPSSGGEAQRTGGEGEAQPSGGSAESGREAAEPA